MQNSPKVLKVVSIIMIVFAAISSVLSLIGVLALGALAGYADSAAVGVVVILGSVVALISCGFQVWAGIVGLRAVNGKGTVKSAYVFGIVLLVLAAISLINAISDGSFGFMTLVGLVLPVLYFLSANQMKKDAEAAAVVNPPMDQNPQ